MISATTDAFSIFNSHKRGKQKRNINLIKVDRGLLSSVERKQVDELL